MKVYVVSENTMIDFCVIKDGQFGDVTHNGSVVETISNPVADNGVVIKVEPEDEDDEDEEEVLLYDGDPGNNKTNSISASFQFPFKNDESLQKPNFNQIPSLETKVKQDIVDSSQEKFVKYASSIGKPVVSKQDPDIKLDSYKITPKCPLSPETGVSSITNFVPAVPSLTTTKRADTEFKLKFINQSGDKQ